MTGYSSPIAAGIQDSSLIAIVELEETTLKLSVKVPQQIMDHRKLLQFQKMPKHHGLMDNSAGMCVSAFYEMMSNLHTSWQEHLAGVSFELGLPL